MYNTGYKQQNNYSTLILELGKLEYGFAAFCFKLAQKAEAEGREELRANLGHQARQEEAHAKMLLAFSPIRRYATESGCQWGCDRITDEHLIFEGISHRYPLARFYFWGRSADSFDWANTLAFLTVGETWGNRVYWVLSQVPEQPLKAIASKIASDERSHGSTLWQHLVKETGVVQALLIRAKWEFRAISAIVRWMVCH